MLSKILLGLSILLMAGAAVLGYMTKGKIDEQKTELTNQVQRATAAEGKATKLTAEVKSLGDQVASAKAESEQRATELASAKGELETAKSAVTASATEIADLKDKLSKVPTTAGDPTTPVDSPQVEDLQKKLTDAETALKEAQQVRDAMQERANVAEAKSKVLQEYKDSRARGMVAVGLEGQVLAVNQAWSFVVLSIGDRQGVTSSAELIVKRGGQQIARVRVSSVEPGSSVADIVPGSLKSGVTVQPGDVVIYKGS